MGGPRRLLRARGRRFDPGWLDSVKTKPDRPETVRWCGPRPGAPAEYRDPGGRCVARVGVLDLAR